MASPTRNLHLPLPPDLHRELMAAARLAGRPATALAREAIDRFLAAKRRAELHRELAAYAAAVAGSTEDLDPSLEAAAVEQLFAKPRKHR